MIASLTRSSECLLRPHSVREFNFLFITIDEFQSDLRTKLVWKADLQIENATIRTILGVWW